MRRLLYALALWFPVVCSAQLTGQYQFVFTTNLPLWDLSGTYSYSNGGFEITKALSHAANGMLTGTGSAHLEEDGTDITATETSTGRVRGHSKTTTTLHVVGRGQFSGQALGRNISGPFVGNLGMALDPASLVLSGNQTASFCVRGLGCRALSTNLTFALPGDMTGGWTLTLDIATSNNVVRGTATAELSNGRTLSFHVRGRFRPATGLTVLRATGTGNAFGTRLRLTLDGAASLQNLGGKLFGQKLVYP
jgi:hypothetical protein